MYQERPRFAVSGCDVLLVGSCEFQEEEGNIGLELKPQLKPYVWTHVVSETASICI